MWTKDSLFSLTPTKGLSKLPTFKPLWINFKSVLKLPGWAIVWKRMISFGKPGSVEVWFGCQWLSSAVAERPVCTLTESLWLLATVGTECTDRDLLIVFKAAVFIIQPVFYEMHSEDNIFSEPSLTQMAQLWARYTHSHHCREPTHPLQAAIWSGSHLILSVTPCDILQFNCWIGFTISEWVS